MVTSLVVTGALLIAVGLVVLLTQIDMHHSQPQAQPYSVADWATWLAVLGLLLVIAAGLVRTLG